MAKKKVIVNKHEFKIDLTVPSIDDSIEVAKEFMSALVLPALSETGLLVKDYITAWRFKNQIKIVTWAKKICSDYGINPKILPVKLLAPFLENAGLEEDEYLQEKWALLLTNMVDSKQNIGNHVFPYILSQISKEEFEFIQSEFERRNLLIMELSEKLSNHRKPLELKIVGLREKIKSIKEDIDILKNKPNLNDHTLWLKQDEIRQLKSAIAQSEHDFGTMNIKNSLSVADYLNTSKIQEYEIANLIRLGILKLTQKPYTRETEIEMPERGGRVWLDVDIQLDVEDCSFTELGEKFILACSTSNL